MDGYAFEVKGHGVFTPEGQKPEGFDAAAHSAKLEADELAAWATKPERSQVYVTKATVGADVTTWTGKKLGTIVSLSRFSNNLSRNIVALRIRGTNGATYSGRYGADWSQLCRVRRCREVQP